MTRKIEPAIKHATVEDAKEILALQKLAYQSEAKIHDDYTIPPLTQTLDEIRAEFEKHFFLKTCVGKKIVGSVRAHVEEGTCSIGRLIVQPEFQNQGIGTRLMNGIEERFQQARRFELFTGHKSKDNLYFYQKLGYREFKRKKVSEKLTLVFLEKSADRRPS